MDTLISAALAAQGSGAAAQQSPVNPYMFIMIAIIGVLFYFTILRPQTKERNERDNMRNSVKKGDRVKTIGGIYGVVAAVDTTNKIVTVQVDKNVKIDFDRDAIQTIIRKEDQQETQDAKKS